MGNSNYPEPLDDGTIAAIEEATQNVWKVLEARKPYPHWDTDPALKTKLAKTFMDLADNGMRDAQELTRHALQMLWLGPSG